METWVLRTNWELNFTNFFFFTVKKLLIDEIRFPVFLQVLLIKNLKVARRCDEKEKNYTYENAFVYPPPPFRQAKLINL